MGVAGAWSYEGVRGLFHTLVDVASGKNWEAVDGGLDRDPGLSDEMRRFLYLPFEHSEDIEDQRRCVVLAEARIADGTFRDYARQHLAIIERFGRFPHRNAALGRESTADEIAFLTGEGSSF